jgi:hypothetical protein
MACDTQRLPNQTITERKQEIREAVATLSRLLAAGSIKPIIGPQGAVAFQGWMDQDRRRVTDACAFRLIMATGSPLAKAKIAAAEALSGRTVDRRVVAHGAHSHDGGRSWHAHKG